MIHARPSATTGQDGDSTARHQEWLASSALSTFIFISSACSSFQSVNPSDPNELSAWAWARRARSLQFRGSPGLGWQRWGFPMGLGGGRVRQACPGQGRKWPARGQVLRPGKHSAKVSRGLRPSLPHPLSSSPCKRTSRVCKIQVLLFRNTRPSVCASQSLAVARGQARGLLSAHASQALLRFYQCDDSERRGVTLGGRPLGVLFPWN